MSELTAVSRRTAVGLLGILGALSALDLFLSWRLIGPDGEYLFEINPLAAWWLERFGWAGMAVFKLVVTLLLITIIGIVLWRRQRTGELLLVFAIGAQSTVVAYSVFLFRFLEHMASDPLVGPAIPIASGEGGATPGRPRSIRGRTNALVVLLSEPAVRDELNLPIHLRDSVDELLRTSIPRGRAMSRNPSDQAAAQEHLKRENELLAALTPEQRQRLRQIAWQQRGPFALADHDVAATLELTGEQRQEVRRALEDYWVMRGPMTRRRADDDGSDEALRKAEEKLGSIATDGQRVAWKQLIGEPFLGSVRAEVTRELRQSGLGTRPFRPR